MLSRLKLILVALALLLPTCALAQSILPAFPPGLFASSTAPAVAASPVAVDALGAHALVNTASTSFSSSSMITVGSGANRALIVVINFGANNTTPPSAISATWGGVAMTQLYNTFASANNGSHGAASVIFGLVNPASGAQTLALSWTNAQFAAIDAISFTGVNQSGNQASFPNGTFFQSAGNSTPTLNINAPANGYIVGTSASFQNFSSITQTQLYLDNSGAAIGAAANYGASPSGGGSVTMTGVTGGPEVSTFSAVGVAPVTAPAYWVSDTFSRYSNGATLQGAIPLIGPAWQTTGAILPTILNGQVVTGSTGVGYLFNNVQATPSSIGAVISFTGGTDMTQMPFAMAYATSANPLSLNDLLHYNLGPDGFNLTIRQAGGSFITIIAQNWVTPIPNDGSLHTVTMSFSGNSVTVTKDSETYTGTNSNIPSVVGGTFFFEPFAGSDGLTCGVSQAWGARMNFLLKRDIDPAANDNTPMWLPKVA
jgi:hypothetical protein